MIARRSRGASAAGGGRLHPHRPRRRAARRRHRHGDGRDQPRPRARPSRTSRTPATARSPGRATARAAASTARSATSCPGYRKITDPAARAHVAAVWGVDPVDHPRPRHPGGRAAAVARHRRAARARCSCTASNVVVSAPNASVVRAALERLDLLVVSRLLPLRDRGTRRCRPARHPVGRGGGHHDEPRRPRSAPPPCARPRRSGVRDELWIMAELARRLEHRDASRSTPARSSTSCARASAGGIADYSGIDDALLDAGAPVHWPCPVGIARHPPPVRGLLRPPRRAGTHRRGRPRSRRRARSRTPAS